jgi:hypothetical protein
MNMIARERNRRGEWGRLRLAYNPIAPNLTLSMCPPLRGTASWRHTCQLSQAQPVDQADTPVQADNDYGERNRPARLELIERNAGACSLRGTPKPCSRPSRRSRSYLRGAEAYMLISMPTCTSTIFGVFQVIRVLLGQRHDCRGNE